TIKGAVTNSGAFTVTGNLVGNSTFTNAASGTLALGANSYTGLTTFTNSGTVSSTTGTLGAATINNAGVMNVATSLALNGAFNNSGSVNLQGATSTLAVSGLTTNAGGTLNMQNGSTTNVVNANGGFNGTGNNTVAVDIALNATQHQSDQLKVTGASNGTTAINFAPVGGVGNLGFFSTPIPVITSTGGGTLNATAVNLP